METGTTPAAEQPRTLLAWLTLERTAVATVFIVVFALGARLVIDTDVWWHLRAGKEILDSGVIRHDSFSYTKAGARWIDHSWGSEVIMNLLWRGFGYGGLELLAGTLALIGGVFVYLMSSGGTYLRASAVACASLTASIFWSPRPQMFSYALTGAVLYILFLRRFRGVDALWLIPVVMLAWANLHGGFAIGFLLVAATLGGEALENLVPRDRRGHLEWRVVRKLGLVGAVSVAAVCINPYGPRLLGVPFATAGGSFTAHLQEWQSPDFRTPGFWPFAVMLALMTILLVANRGRVGWTDLILCAGATALALSAGRNVSTFAIVVTPILTYLLADLLQGRRSVSGPRQRPTPRLAIVNLLLILIVAAVAAVFVVEPFDHGRLVAAERSTLPVGDVAYLAEHPPRGRLFNDYAFGGYLTYALPAMPVFVDGRSDLYGGAFLDKYLEIVSGRPGWQEELARYGVTAVLVPTDSGLAGTLRRSSDWSPVHHDPVSTVFELRRD